MILIGDENIPCEDITEIISIEDIARTKSNATLAFKFNITILKYTSTNDLNSAVVVNNIKEVIYASALNAKYIICDIALAKQAQKLAENYMFDSKILAIIENSDQIEQVALDEIDGAIYTNLIERVI